MFWVCRTGPADCQPALPAFTVIERPRATAVNGPSALRTITVTGNGTVRPNVSWK